jgi:galactonate dehydratase
MAERLAPFRTFWHEEPVPPDSLQVLAVVRQKISIPVAVGERYFEPNRFTEALDRKALDFFQPDVCHVGGWLEMKRVSSLGLLY